MIQLHHYLIFAAALFAIGLFGVLSRRNLIVILIGIELMMNAANLNLVAFWRYRPGPLAEAGALTGQIFTLIGISVAAAEAAVGLALVLAIYRSVRSVDVDDIDQLRG